MGRTTAVYSNVSTDDASLEDTSSSTHKRPRLKSPGRSLRTLFRDVCVRIRQLSFASARDLCLTFWRNTIIDLKSVSWLQLLHVFIRDVIPVFFIVALICGIARMAELREMTFPKSLCQPDGTAYVGGFYPYDPWKLSETFTINISFGKFKVLSFGTAKLVDAISDVLLGRGVQAILAFISYIVSARALSRLMESRPVSYGTFEAVTLQQNSVTAFLKLVWDFSRNKGLKARLTIAWLLFSAALLLIYPTLASAMTGYSASITSQITLWNGTRVPAKSFQKVFYTIHDASRLGPDFYDDYTIVDHQDGDPDLSTGWTEDYVVYATDMVRYRTAMMDDCAKYSPASVDKTSDQVILSSKFDFAKRPDCALLWDVSRYASIYGLGGMKNASSVFNNSATNKSVSLPSPSLNISTFSYADLPMGWHFSQAYNKTPNAWALLPYAHFVNDTYQTYQQRWYNATNYVYRQSFQVYALKDTAAKTDYIMNVTSMIQNASCQQQAQDSLSQTPIQYSWGFSYQLLTSCLIILLVWSIGTYAIHIDALLNSRLIMEKREMGLRRAVLDAAREYESRLEGTKPGLKGDSQLKKLIGNGAIAYDHLIMIDGSATRRERITTWWKFFEFKIWMRREWKLLLPLTIFFFCFYVPSLVSSGLWVVVDPVFGWLPCFGTIIMLMIGRHHASRWIVLVSFISIYIILHFSSGIYEDT